MGAGTRHRRGSETGNPIGFGQVFVGFEVVNPKEKFLKAQLRLGGPAVFEKRFHGRAWGREKMKSSPSLAIPASGGFGPASVALPARWSSSVYFLGLRRVGFVFGYFAKGLRYGGWRGPVSGFSGVWRSWSVRAEGRVVVS
ncbi:uncharacterized protein TM35_000321570 [Trypanosoma theileri]|uniref:Uncharacterized protein n=1 Tax=Trypanosoma theileri TaxID=67003 RepID=A0A1X0NM75_9TRYP|nr:uncharacterized protein TM35_000321570 [Trypanosoma theileri]ORC85842.1 hypothetical protein TM35_000321570 [Trypanosoma theileri]